MSIRNKIKDALKENDWSWCIEASTNKNLTPEEYLVLAASLALGAGRTKEANSLIREGAQKYQNDDNILWVSALLHFLSRDWVGRGFDLPETQNKRYNGLINLLKKYCSENILIETYLSGEHIFSNKNIKENLKDFVRRKDWLSLYCACELMSRSMISDNFDQSYVLKHLVYSLIKLNLKSELVGTLRNSRELHQDSLWWMAANSYVSYFDKDYSSIVSIMTAMMPTRITEEDDIFYSLAFEFYADSLLRIGNKQGLSELLSKDLKLNGDSAWQNAFQPIVNQDLKWKNKVDSWQKAGEDNNFCLNHLWGVNSFRDVFVWKFSEDIGLPVFGAEKLRDAKRVVLACADANYAKTFAFNILFNAKHNPAVHFHFHLMVRDRSELLPLISEISKFENTSVSIEQLAIPVPKAYYTIVRFPIAREILKQSNAVVAVADIDFLSDKIGDALDIFVKSQSTLGLRFINFYHHFPWHSVQINFFILRKNEISRQFVDYISNYVERKFNPFSRYQWWIDQVAVACACQDLGLSRENSGIDKQVGAHLSFAGSSDAQKADFLKNAKSLDADLAETTHEVIKA